jgi:hypothetical protein
MLLAKLLLEGLPQSMNMAFFFFEMCSLRSDEVKEASLDRYFLPLDLCGELFSKFSPLLYASSDAASQK